MLDQRKLQIFVSSTFVDLQQERQEAVSAILKAGHIPAGMELFTAGDKSQLETIKRWIDHSDVYMLILGTRYGSIEPDSGLSYTEVEYDYAISKGKPFFALVISEDAIDLKLKKSGARFVEKAHPERLKVFRNKVLSRMSAIYQSHSDIRAHVYESLIDLSSRPDLDGWIRATNAPNVKDLYDKISSLTKANEKLERELSELSATSSAEQISDPERGRLISLISVMKSLKLTVPANIATNGNAFDSSVYNLFVLNRHLFVRGVTVNSSSNEKTKYFEDNLYSVLVRHRLLELEIKPNGIRSYSITDLGISVSAQIDLIALEESDANPS